MSSNITKSATATVTDDSASTRSFLSTTTTLKGTGPEPTKKKWFSKETTDAKTNTNPSKPKRTNRHTKKEISYEVLATYLALR